jgi:hypothetical protein
MITDFGGSWGMPEQGERGNALVRALLLLLRDEESARATAHS